MDTAALGAIAIPDSIAPWTPPATMPTRYGTERYTLRVFEPADTVALWLAIQESRESLWPWLPWAREDHLSLAHTSFTIEKFRREFGAEALQAGRLNLVVGIFDRETGRLLGGTGAHTFRPALHQAEVGYWVRASERGRGVCTHAARAMIDWLLAAQSDGGWGLRRVEIVCAGGNGASAAVARRSGAMEEGRTRGDRWIPGRGWDDTLRFGVVRRDDAGPPVR